jgi:hypothetical protein
MLYQATEHVTPGVSRIYVVIRYVMYFINFMPCRANQTLKVHFNARTVRWKLVILLCELVDLQAITPM